MDESVDPVGAPTSPSPSTRAANPPGPARIGIGTAFRLSFRPLDIRGDIASLLGKVGEGESLAPGIAHILLRRREVGLVDIVKTRHFEQAHKAKLARPPELKTAVAFDDRRFSVRPETGLRGPAGPAPGLPAVP